jgi:hypothetical protein
MQPIVKILLKNAVFTFLITVISIVLFKTAFSNYYLPAFWAMLFGMAVFTAILHITLIKLTSYNISKFSTRFILITGIKMILFLTVIVTYSFLNPEHAVPFLIIFLILYILFSVFEVVVILPFFKKQP